MIIFDKLYLDDTIKRPKKVIKKVVSGNFKKDYFVLLFDFNSSETLDIICTSYLPSLKNKEDLALVGIAKTKEVAIQHSVQFFQDILDDGADVMNFNFNEYITSNSKKE